MLALLLAAAASRAPAQGVVPTPMISVRVQDEAGIALQKGRVEIGALKRWALIERGQATIADLPGGSWMVAVRVPGFRAESLLVEAAVHPAKTPVVTLHSTGEVVMEETDTATYVPSAKDSVVLREAAARMATGHGTLIRYDDLAVRTAMLASDALRAARSFRWLTESTIKTNTGCVTLPKADTLTRRGMRTIALFVDGNRMASALESVNRLVAPREILVIETYADPTTTPIRWRSTDACAAIAFWTKR